MVEGKYEAQITRYLKQYEQAHILSLEEGKLSITSLRKGLHIGYGRAKRMFNHFQEMNYIDSEGKLNKEYIPYIIKLKRQRERQTGNKS